MDAMGRIIASIAILFASMSVYAATPQSWAGGSGIGFMRTAQVMHEGESSWSLNMGSDLFDSVTTPGTTASLSTAQLGYAASIGGHTELGLNIPYALYSPDATGTTLYSGTQEVRGFLKHSLTYPEKQDGFGAAITFYSSVTPGDAATNVTSGEPQYGTELNISHWTQTTAIHLNIGSENRDVWDESVTPSFTSDRLLNLGLGIEIGLSTAMGMTIEALMSQSPARSQENMFLGLVFQYMPNKHWAFTLGGGAGTPSGTNFPTTRLLFGMTYSPRGKYQSRYTEAASYVDYYKLTKDLQQKVEALSTKVEQLEHRLKDTDKQVEENQKSLDASKYDYSGEY